MSTAPFESSPGGQTVRPATAADAIDGVDPRWVVQPSCVEEMVADVAVAAREELSLVPRGLGRHLSLGNPPRRADVVLSTKSLDRVLNHEPADMTVQVQAGCRLPDLQEVLARNDQWLPIDPPGAAGTTVGGLIAANLSGPLRASQGTTRDLLIGLRTITPDGTLVSGGGRVVKNVAGYDLPKMHIGALGTLGIIVDATFKVRPRPARENALSLQCESGSQASATALELRDACEPFWLEVRSPQTDADSFAVVVAAAGSDEEVEAALARYGDVGRKHGLAATHVDEAATLRGAITDSTASADHCVLRLATLPTRIGACLDSLESAAQRHALGMRAHANVVNGVIRASLGTVEETRDTLPALIAELRPGLERDGDALVVERASVASKAALADLGGVWGDPGPGLALMRALKETFDPDARLAPGRFVGGL